MASYQAHNSNRRRDPLLDQATAVALEKRGRELLGIVLILMGLAVAAMLVSYSPDDPSWLSATDAPVQNWMGRFGAYVVAPLFMIVGLGAWSIAIVMLVWGARFTLHRSAGRTFSRLVFAPIWLALCAVYASGLPQGAGWSHHFGLGGLFGDMIMGSALTALPMSPAVGLKLMMLFLGVAILVVGAYVLGFVLTEMKSVVRFLTTSVMATYAMLREALGRGAGGTIGVAKALQAKHAARRDAGQFTAATMPQSTAASGARVQRAIPPLEPTSAKYTDSAHLWAEPEMDQVLDAPTFSEPKKEGLFARMPSLMRRSEPEVMPEPELIQPEMDHDVAVPGEDRVKAKIAHAIRAHRPAATPLSVQKPDPTKPLTKGRGFGPQPLVFSPKKLGAAIFGTDRTKASETSDSTLPPEPPVTARAATLVAAPPLRSALPPVGGASDMWREAEPELSQSEPPYPAQQMPYSAAESAGWDERAENPYEDLGDFDDYGAYDENTNELTEGTTDASLVGAAPVAFKPAFAVQPEAKKVVQPQVRKPVKLSTRAIAEAQPSLQFEERKVEYELPPLSLLMSPDQVERHHLSDEALEENARMLETVLDDYGVKGEIVSVRPGPVVTMYELEPAPGLKASRVIGLADDIARSMSALSARVSTVPGRSVIGIELPNDKREMVCFREILAGRDFGDGKHKLPLALGKDIGGDPIVANLAKMPHLLIAGTTGSGKSVAINTMILSLLYKLSPEELRLVMIDPKMLELSVYDGIPHLLSPVVTDPKKAVVALKWVVGEMEDRYRKMSKMGVRNIDGYNGRVEHALAKNEMFSRTVQTGFDDETGEPIFETDEFEPKKMPYIVVIVDEMADLMMVAGKEIEACIQRLAQMARASGIHLIMATQRPSVDVITGTIKANFPTRISFQVTSKIDSRTILGEMGAEQLLGMGDMLYMAGGAKITRCHGPFVSDEEVEEIVNHLKAFGPPDYVGGVVEGPDEEKADGIDAVLGLNTGGNTGGEDALYDQAVAIVIKDRKCSTSYIQRKLGIGYNKAARLVEQMEEENIVSPANHVGKRDILVPEQA